MADEVPTGNYLNKFPTPLDPIPDDLVNEAVDGALQLAQDIDDILQLASDYALETPDAEWGSRVITVYDALLIAEQFRATGLSRWWRLKLEKIKQELQNLFTIDLLRSVITYFVSFKWKLAARLLLAPVKTLLTTLVAFDELREQVSLGIIEPIKEKALPQTSTQKWQTVSYYKRS